MITAGLFRNFLSPQERNKKNCFFFRKTLRDTLTEKFGVDAENLPDVAKYIFGKFSEYDVDQLLDGELDEEKEIEMIGPAAKIDVPELKRSRSRSRSVTSRNRALSTASFSNADLVTLLLHLDGWES